LEGVIPIALSYKIIKNSSSTEDREKHLQTIDISAFIANEELTKELEGVEESDPRESLETKIRKEVMSETVSKRQAIIDNAILETEQIKENARIASASEGYEQGYKEGFQFGHEEARKLTRDEDLPVVGSLGVEDGDELVVLIGNASSDLLVVRVCETRKKEEEEKR